MLTRLLKLPQSLSFFLFGPRATGKSTLLSQSFGAETTHTFDLLDQSILYQFLDSLSAFGAALDALPASVDRVVVDEVQRAPALLDIVQAQMAHKRFQFVLTGSSARKLRRGQANLLGGRALSHSLWPLTCAELGTQPSWVHKKLNWGGLPLVVLNDSSTERAELLRAYEDTYLSEEVVAEQLVRNLTPFRRFLSVAAQMNGKIINHSNIGRDLGVSHNTISSYFEILEDTLIGFRLLPYHSGVRKKLRSKPKFYLFDTGVKRQLARQLGAELLPGTSAYGDAFEHLVILEFKALVSYLKPDWELCFLQSHAGAEVDLVIDRGSGDPILVEIKSTDNISLVNLKSETELMKDLRSKHCYFLSQDPLPKKLDGGVMAFPWQQGLREILEL